MKFRISLLLLVACISLNASAQKSTVVYKPKNLDSVQNYITTITAKKAKSFSGSHQKEIQKILEERKETFIKGLKDSSYIFDDRINKYLKGILSEIYRSNKSLNTTDFYFFVDKSPIPNAACYGNGIFTINLGLLDLVGSDDELAFIICHEIAHYTLKHNDQSLLNHVETMNSKETKKKISSVKRQQYGRRKAATELFKNLSYNFQKRSRKAEMQADSLGFAMFSNTRFNKVGAEKSLLKLKETDSLLFTTNTNIRKHFNFEGYPFKEGWLAAEETLFDLKEKSDDLAFDKDSLKTHPDMPVRIAQLRKFYSGSGDIQASTELAQVKKIAIENSIAVSIDDFSLDMALYQILSLRERNEIDQKIYLNTVASLLRTAYELKQSHNFGKYLAPVSPFSDEKYMNEVRQFLQNVELKNLRKIGYHFCTAHQSEMQGDNSFAENTAFFTKLNP